MEEKTNKNNKVNILLGITLLSSVIGGIGYYFKDNIVSYLDINNIKSKNIAELDKDLKIDTNNTALFNELNSLKKELKKIKLSSSVSSNKQLNQKQIEDLKNQLNQKIAELNRKIIILVKVNKIFYSKLNQINKTNKNISKQKEHNSQIEILFKKTKQLITNQNTLIDNITLLRKEIEAHKKKLTNLQKENSNLKITFNKQIKDLSKQIEKLKKEREIVDLGFKYVGFTISHGKKIGYISTNAGKVYNIKVGATINSIYKVISITNTTLIIENKRNHKVYSLTLKN